MSVSTRQQYFPITIAVKFKTEFLTVEVFWSLIIEENIKHNRLTVGVSLSAAWFPYGLNDVQE